MHCKLILLNLHRGYFLKQLLTLLSLLMFLIPSVYAEDDKWIDGIKFQFGTVQNGFYFTSPSSDPASNNYLFSPSESDLKSQMFPVSIVFPETLMNSFSFRGAYFFYTPLTKATNLIPGSSAKTGGRYYRQSSADRDWLNNNFFNSEDKDFISGKSNWALSGEYELQQISLGYYWGLFIPVGKSNRLLKAGLGFSLVKLNAKINLYLCEEFIDIASSEERVVKGKCDGKKEIDSSNIDTFVGSIVSHFTVWEKHTESSIWKIIGFTGTVNSTDINFKYDKHAGSLNEAVISSYIGMVS
mgnify:FL=1